MSNLIKEPDEVYMASSRLVQDGKFRVFGNGVIYKIKNGQEALATICMTTKLKKYGVVRFTENGKQKSYYVHRLVAEAFCENPNNYPQVNHLDGNTFNNTPGNLEWCTAKQNVIHAHRTGLISLAKYGYPCKTCHQPTRAKGGLCPICKLNTSRKEKSDSNLSLIKEELDDVNLESLTKRKAEILSLRLSGKTFREIGNELHITHQRVGQAMKSIMMRNIFD